MESGKWRNAILATLKLLKGNRMGVKGLKVCVKKKNKKKHQELTEQDPELL